MRQMQIENITYIYDPEEVHLMMVEDGKVYHFYGSQIYQLIRERKEILEILKEEK